jgi:hypothetical protein
VSTNATSGADSTARRSGSQPDQQRDRHQQVGDQRRAQRDQDGPGQRALRVAHLLAQGGDPGVAGEGEEHQAGRGAHAEQPAAHRAPGRTRATGAVSGRPHSPITTTTSSTDQVPPTSA